MFSCEKMSSLFVAVLVAYATYAHGLTLNHLQQITRDTTNLPLTVYESGCCFSGDGRLAAITHTDPNGADVHDPYVYVYDTSDWSIRASFAATGAGARFGIEETQCSMNGDGTIIVVGDPNPEGGSGPDSGNGRCFVYQWNGVDEYEELVALRDALRGDDQQYFGASCVISQDSSVVVVGAVDLFEDTLAHHAQAFVFSGPSYSIMTELVPTFPAPQGAADPRAEYGHFIDVSVDGTLIVVTAPFYGTGDIILNPNGVVFIFKWTGSTWEQTQAIECPIADADGTNFFGWTAQFSEDNSKLAVVSRRNGLADGRLYVFERPDADSDYALVQTMTPDPAVTHSRVDWWTNFAFSADGSTISLAYEYGGVGAEEEGVVSVYNVADGSVQSFGYSPPTVANGFATPRFCQAPDMSHTLVSNNLFEGTFEVYADDNPKLRISSSAITLYDGDILDFGVLDGGDSSMQTVLIEERNNRLLNGVVEPVASPFSGVSTAVNFGLQSSTMTISIFVTAPSLPGVYDSDLLITSSDPLRPSTTITLRVTTAGPTISVDVSNVADGPSTHLSNGNVLDFGSVVATEVRFISVTNTGAGGSSLDLSSLTDLAGECTPLSVNQAIPIPTSITTGAEVLEVSVPAGADFSCQMVIESNSNPDATFSVTITASPALPPTVRLDSVRMSLKWSMYTPSVVCWTSNVPNLQLQFSLCDANTPLIGGIPNVIRVLNPVPVGVADECLVWRAHGLIPGLYRVCGAVVYDPSGTLQDYVLEPSEVLSLQVRE